MDLIPADIQAIPAAVSQSTGAYFEPRAKIHRPLSKNEHILPLDTFTASGTDTDWAYIASQSGGYIVALHGKKIRSNNKNTCDSIKSNTNSLIEKIQNTFNLTVEETADVCGVTRKTLYNWKDGDSPQKSKYKRLIEVAYIADQWMNSALSSERMLLEKPVYNGRTIMELLTDKHLDKDAIIFAGSRLQFKSINDSAPIEDPFA